MKADILISVKNFVSLQSNYDSLAQLVRATDS